MKKVIFIVAALMAVFSGVAAVSAYEGHMIDIKVHVENAIGVLTPEDLDFGTMFPQETVESDISWGMSRSFYAQDRLSEIGYELYFEIKDKSHHPEGTPVPLYENGYFQPLNPFMTVTTKDVELELEDPEDYQAKPTAANPIVLLGTGRLYWTNTGLLESICSGVHIHTDIPVFEGYHNVNTDPTPKEWNFCQLDEGEFELVEECICGVVVEVPHADLGINFKIQVIGFTDHSGVRTSWDYPYTCE